MNARLSPLLFLLTAPASAQVGDYDTWIGYDTAEYPAAFFPYELELGDFDQDGDVDAVAANHWATPVLSFLYNRGDGSFEAPVHLSQAKSSRGMLVLDVDQDGDLDVLSSNTGTHWEGTSVAVFRNQGDGTFSLTHNASTLAEGPTGMAAADFDLDGDPDVAVACWGHIGLGTQVAVLWNDGAGSFTAPTLLTVGQGPYRLATGDLDADGWPDLAVARDKSKVSVLLNTGGGFGPPAEHTINTLPLGGDAFPNLHVGDAEHDGDLDLYYSSTKTAMGTDPSWGAVALLLNDGAGSFGSIVREPIVTYLGGASNSTLADLDADGWLDYLSVHFDAGGWAYMHADGAGGFETGFEVPAGEDPGAVRVADANGDGWSDVLVLARSSLELVVHAGDGTGHFRSHPGTPLVDFGTDMDAADVDHDGDLDVAASGAYAGSGHVEVLRNQGDGSFAPPTQHGAGPGAMAVKLRDLDGDGWADLLWADDPTSFPYDFWTARNDGAGGFLPAVEWPVGTCGNGDVDAFDLDGDGDLDVLLTEALGCGGVSGNRLFVALNGGDGSFDPATQWTTVLRPGKLDCADLDGDGRMDVVVTTAGGLEIGFGAGDGSFGPPTTLALLAGTNDVIARDLDADGVLDLAAGASNGASGAMLHVFRGLGGGAFALTESHPASYSPDLAHARDVRANDVDGDGDLDLLAMNDGAGTASLYRNAGDGTFHSQVRYGLGPTVGAFVTADFTGDGAPDIAATVGIPPSNLGRELVVVAGRGSSCPTPGPYCTAKTNSLGGTAALGWSGTPSAFADDFRVTVTGAIPGQPGIAFHGSNGPAALPFLGGTLCVQAPLLRLAPHVADAEGATNYEIDIDPTMSGTTRWYQYWYRDPAHPDGTGVGLSNGLAVTFCN